MCRGMSLALNCFASSARSISASNARSCSNRCSLMDLGLFRSLISNENGRGTVARLAPHGQPRSG